MPRGTLHQKKFRTNLAIFLAVLAFCALIWAITMIRIGGQG